MANMIKDKINDVYDEVTDEYVSMHKENEWVEATLDKVRKRNQKRSELKRNLKKLADEL